MLHWTVTTLSDSDDLTERETTNYGSHSALNSSYSIRNHNHKYVIAVDVEYNENKKNFILPDSIAIFTIVTFKGYFVVQLNTDREHNTLPSLIISTRCINPIAVNSTSGKNKIYSAE